jgi:hypothetical protein
MSEFNSPAAQSEALTERLLAHLHVLCEQIGPRPPATRGEQRAAEYVRQQLWALAIDDVREQPFRSPGTAGVNVLPLAAMAALAQPLSRLGRFGKLNAAGLMIASFFGLRDFLLGTPSPFSALFDAAESRNVIARIAPSQEMKRILFIVAHLDSGKQRYTLPLPVPGATRPALNAALSLLLISAATLIWDALTGRKQPRAVQNLTGVVALGALAGLMLDETQPHVEGANDNASGVSVALELAAALKREPLQHTEVVLLFTGSATTGCAGIEAYVDQYAPPRDDTFWLNLEMLGGRGLCYVALGGVSAYSAYRPGPRITAMAGRVARRHPELRVTGRSLTILDESALLRQRGYEAICLAGHDDQGEPPHWHRLSDVVETIAPEDLARAHVYALHLIREIDAQAK